MLKLLWTQAELADKGIMCRGGIALGLASHTPEHVFGPAVVAAYNMEQQANYPRIVTTEDVLVSGAKDRTEENSYEYEYGYLTEILKLDDDGLYYVDYFSAIQTEIDNYGHEYPIYLHRLRDHIHTGLQHQDIRIKQKYEWMKHKYNVIVEQILYNITNHGNPNADPELVDYYMTLQKVTG